MLFILLYYSMLCSQQKSLIIHCIKHYNNNMKGTKVLTLGAAQCVSYTHAICGVLLYA